MNKNIIISLVIMSLMITIVTSLPSGTVYKYEPVLLAEGWNGLGIITNYSSLIQGDFNLSLVNSTGGSLNLLGMSFMTPNGKCISLDSLTFWDVDDNSMNYEDAKTNNWIEPIQFTENLETTGEIEEFQTLCPYEAIWVKSYLAVNMTISDVLGSPIGETFNWTDLRFSNGSEERGIVSAGAEGWVDTTLKYWNTDKNGFRDIAGTDNIILGHKSTISSLEGVFVRSYQNNIYLLTNNETKKNVIKVKCNAKFIGDDGVCHMPSGKAKYVGGNKVFKFKAWTSHIMRLIGSLRITKG